MSLLVDHVICIKPHHSSDCSSLHNLRHNQYEVFTKKKKKKKTTTTIGGDLT